jgi:hypothetical protein
MTDCRVIKRPAFSTAECQKEVLNTLAPPLPELETRNLKLDTRSFDSRER